MGSSTSKSTHSRAVEDYVKHIFKLTSGGGKATTKLLSQRMRLGQGTVSGMLKHLAKRGLVEHRPYYGVTLTAAGHKLAMRIIRRHRLIELFLVKSLGLAWDEVDGDAERMEHAVSEELVDRMDEYLGRPNVDPHGSPIPTAEGKIERQDFQLLSTLGSGQQGVVRRVGDSDPKFLRFLDEQGIKLNRRLKVVGVGPFGSMRVKVGRRQTHLPREAAERIAVAVG
jgi:DtxR family transcriptional regulator, Mn-dependent transcriptional regulator